MSKSILKNFQTNSKKETDNLKDRPAPHCGESPVPASSLPAVAVLRPSLLRDEDDDDDDDDGDDDDDVPHHHIHDYGN